MTQTNFVDSVQAENTRLTSDGYLVADVRCARTGIQVYDAREIGLEADGPVRVYRPPAVVFAKDSLATYAGKPVTMNHPDRTVDASNWREHAVGEVGDEVARDGEFVRVPMRLMDQAAIDAVSSGQREISMGYSTGVLLVSGRTEDGQDYDAIQTGPIRVNHLAVVQRARGGKELRIGDGASNWGAAPQPTEKETTMPEQFRSIVVDGLTVQTTDQGAQAIEKLQQQLADSQSAMQTRDARIQELETTVETRDGEITALKKQVEDASSPERMAQAVRQRQEVLEAARRAGVSDTETMTDAQVRRAVVAKSLGDAVAKDMSDDAVQGAFAAVSARTPEQSVRVSQTSDEASSSWSNFVPMKKEA